MSMIIVGMIIIIASLISHEIKGNIDRKNNYILNNFLAFISQIFSLSISLRNSIDS